MPFVTLCLAQAAAAASAAAAPMSVFEIGMLVCFGASWPLSVWKSYRTKVVQGKSLAFMAMILIGYGLGSLHKIYFNYNWILWLYVMNGTFVFIDILFYLRYSRRELPPAGGAA